MTILPKDPVILLSFMNMRLRDYDATLDECCKTLGIREEEITSKLRIIGYTYDEKRNQFI